MQRAVDRATRIKIDPFLLPSCEICDGPLNLAYIEPVMGSAPERRAYRCARCHAEQILPVPDHAKKNYTKS
jgi:hypothetical protein